MKRYIKNLNIVCAIHKIRRFGQSYLQFRHHICCKKIFFHCMMAISWSWLAVKTKVRPFMESKWNFLTKFVTRVIKKPFLKKCIFLEINFLLTAFLIAVFQLQFNIRFVFESDVDVKSTTSNTPHNPMFWVILKDLTKNAIFCFRWQWKILFIKMYSKIKLINTAGRFCLQQKFSLLFCNNKNWTTKNFQLFVCKNLRSKWKTKQSLFKFWFSILYII